MEIFKVGEKLKRQMEAWEGDSNCGLTSSSCPELPCGQVGGLGHQHHHDGHRSLSPRTIQLCLYTLVNSSPSTITAEHRTPVARYMLSSHKQMVSISDNWVFGAYHVPQPS